MTTRFVSTKGELAFEEVLRFFLSASEICIATYNLSKKSDRLIELLDNVKAECHITLITNIPARWPSYFLNTDKKRVYSEIQMYLRKLKKLAEKENVSVYFNFINHGKIVMTDELAYIGSANFSDESSTSREFGVLVDDHALINEIKAEVERVLEVECVPYFEYDYLELIKEVNQNIDVLTEIISDLSLNIFSVTDQGVAYISDDLVLREEDIETIESDIENSLELLGSINAVFEIIDNRCNETETVLEVIDEFKKLESMLQSYCNSPLICELSSFNEANFADNILIEEYGMAAYDEDLEKYQQLALESSIEKKQSLIEDAEEDLKGILDALRQLQEKAIELLVLLENNRDSLIKVSEGIDNTNSVSAF